MSRLWPYSSGKSNRGPHTLSLLTQRCMVAFLSFIFCIRLFYTYFLSVDLFNYYVQFYIVIYEQFSVVFQMHFIKYYSRSTSITYHTFYGYIVVYTIYLLIHYFKNFSHHHNSYDLCSIHKRNWVHTKSLLIFNSWKRHESSRPNWRSFVQRRREELQKSIDLSDISQISVQRILKEEK